LSTTVTGSTKSNLDHPSPEMIAQWKRIEQFALDPIVYRRRIEERKREELVKAKKLRYQRNERKKRMTL
jgi:hypothetical protein